MISLPPAKNANLQERRIIITSMESIAVIHPLSCSSFFWLVGCGLISPPSVAGPDGAYIYKNITAAIAAEQGDLDCLEVVGHRLIELI